MSKNFLRAGVSSSTVLRRLAIRLGHHSPLVLRNQVIASILAGVRSPRMGRKPKVWTTVNRRYEQIRIDMQYFFTDLGLITPAT